MDAGAEFHSQSLAFKGTWNAISSSLGEPPKLRSINFSLGSGQLYRGLQELVLSPFTVQALYFGHTHIIKKLLFFGVAGHVVTSQVSCRLS